MHAGVILRVSSALSRVFHGLVGRFFNRRVRSIVIDGSDDYIILREGDFDADVLFFIDDAFLRFLILMLCVYVYVCVCVCRIG